MSFEDSKVDMLRPIIYRYSDTYPDLSITKLSQKIIKEEENIEYTAGSLRRLVGAVLSERRAMKASVKDIDTIFGDGDVNADDIYVPRSWAEKRERFIIPGAVKKLLIMSDLHIPFHDPEAIRIAIKYGMENKMDGILFNGDLADNYSISRFIKNPTFRNYKQELDIAGEFLRKLREKFPTLKIYYKYGNHEERLEKLVMAQAQDLWGIEELELYNLLKLPQLQIPHIADKRIINFGKLNIIHGHEIWGGGINVARNFRIKARDNILFGHFHRWQQESVPTITGKIQGAFSVGCLCNLQPLFMPINDWIQGFAFVTRGTNGFFDAKNFKIINGEIK
jgi:predicted phosphodiesterase